MGTRGRAARGSRHMRRTLGIALIVTLSLCGCKAKPGGGGSSTSAAADNDGLTPDLATSLIKANLPRIPCDAQWRQGNFGDDFGTNDAGREEGERLAGWIKAHVIENPAQFTLQADTSPRSQDPDSFGQFQTSTQRTYRDPDGNAASINLYASKFRNGHRNGQVSYSEQRSATLNFCSFKLNGVTILDTTVDQTGKSAEVIFVQKTIPTTVANLINSDTSIAHPDFSPPPMPQQHAHFRRLDATGWQFEGMS